MKINRETVIVEKDVKQLELSYTPLGLCTTLYCYITNYSKTKLLKTINIISHTFWESGIREGPNWVALGQISLYNGLIVTKDLLGLEDSLPRWLTHTPSKSVLGIIRNFGSSPCGLFHRLLECPYIILVGFPKGSDPSDRKLAVPFRTQSLNSYTIPFTLLFVKIELLGPA